MEAKNLVRDLAAAAVVDGRRNTRGPALLVADRAACQCQWPGRGCRGLAQIRWASALSKFSSLLLRGGRKGSDTAGRGGGHLFTPTLSNALAQRQRKPEMMRENEMEEAQLVDHHRGLLGEAMKADNLMEEERIGVHNRAMPDAANLRLWATREQTVWLFVSMICARLKCPLFFISVDWSLGACLHSDARHEAEEHPLSKMLCGLPFRINTEVNLCSKENRAPLPVDECGASEDCNNFQIFIKLSTGNSMLVWVNKMLTVEALRAIISSRMGYHASDFYLVHAGKTMQDSSKLLDYQICRNTTISLLIRLRGGAVDKQNGPIPSNKGVGSSKNRGTAGPFSYKDAARTSSQPKGPHATADPLPTQPGPYIVEKLDEIPALEVKTTEVKNLFNTLQTHALVCRFNGFWPRSVDLHNWVYSNWTTRCQVLLCSKGFFVVQFESQEEYQKILKQGPWFWGRAGLFITPWFPDFDADNMVVTKMPVWVRLPNLPLPYWHPEVLEDIGNRLGKYITCDEERREQGLFTYARICVEIDLSKGLPDKIQLQHESYKRIQALDYENTAFRCRICHQTGHLNDSCPHARRFPKKKKGPNTRGKTWQAEYEPSNIEESDYEVSDMEGRQREEEPEEATTFSATREAKNTDTEKADPKKEGTGPQNTSGNHMAESRSGTETQTALVIHEVAPSSGAKRGHESEKSDSDKEVPAKQKPELVNGREVIVATTSSGRWVEVKNKRKGKKGKIEAYYQP